MADVVDRALALWSRPLPAGDAALASFREVYADPLRVNGAEVGLVELVERAQMLQGAVADLTPVVDDLLVAPGRRVFAFRIRGRHVGALTTPLGTLPATGRTLELAGMDIFDVDEATGRVIAVRASVDYAGLVASLAVAPDAAHDDARPTGLVGAPVAATVRDAAELLVLQRCCWVAEAISNDTLEIPALHESLDDVRAWLGQWSTWCVRAEGRLVGAVRARRDGTAWEIGRLMVAPDLAGRGIGRSLLRHAEHRAPEEVDVLTLVTGTASRRNIGIYESAGYVRTGEPAPPGAVRLTKRRRPAT